MRIRASTVAGLAIVMLTPACTAAELQAFAVGLSAAAEEYAYQNAAGPTYCNPGYRLELGYDAYNNPVRFCVANDPYYPPYLAE